MKKLVSSLSVALFLLGFQTVVAQESTEEEDGGIGLEVSLDVVSKYVWRGFDLNHKDPTIQPSITYSFPFVKGLSLNAWSWIGGKNKNKDDKQMTLDEVDLTLSYEYEFIPEKFSGSVSLINYNYLSDWSSIDVYNDNDIEINAALYYTVNQYFVPYISYYRGLDKGESKEIAANYLEFGAAGAYAFNEQWTIAPTISAAYSDQYTGPKAERIKKGINHVALNVPVTYASGAFSVTPSVSFVKPLRDLNGDDKKAILFGGVNCTYAF
jgi:hypothetical protein